MLFAQRELDRPHKHTLQIIGSIMQSSIMQMFSTHVFKQFEVQYKLNILYWTKGNWNWAQKPSSLKTTIN